MYQGLFKPLFDILLATTITLIVMPFFIPLIVFLKIKNKSVFFTQDRIGKNNKIFTIYKLKTMLDLYDDNGNLLPDEERLTKMGSFLRKFSIDEIPQLLNVFKLELSFIGPRPLLVEYLPLYNKEQIKRHDVKPGLSGLAQINGRNVTTWEKRFEYDLEYVRNISLKLDVKIILLTFKKVFFADGIMTGSGKPMPKFTGNE